MNLKEAFRFQNKLNGLLSEAENVLERDSNVMKVENTYLRKKVMAEAENETVLTIPDTDYADRITELAGFAVFLLGEKEKLSKAIRAAKNGLDIDIDGETSLNGARQNAARVFKHMADLRSSEVTISNGGTGYRFNTDGNQVSYKCDVRRVTTINFDRNDVRKYAKELGSRADEISSEIDKAVVNTEVGYDCPFDVNASFADAFETFCEKE